MHCRIDDDTSDGLLAMYLMAARQDAEHYTRRALITQTWALTLDTWPSVIELPMPPLQSVSSVTYISGGNTLTMPSAGYRVVSDGVFGRIKPVDGWPDADSIPNAITVTFVAGYDPARVPDGVRTAILLHVEIMVDRDPNGTPVLERARDALLDPYRVLRVS